MKIHKIQYSCIKNYSFMSILSCIRESLRLFAVETPQDGLRYESHTRSCSEKPAPKGTPRKLLQPPPPSHTRVLLLPFDSALGPRGETKSVNAQKAPTSSRTYRG